MPDTPAHQPVLVAAARSPIGTAGHAFAGITVIDLAAPVLAAVADRVRPLGVPIDEVVLGNCLGPGGNIARSAALAAGLGSDVPAVTVDRQCGSGLEAIRLAAQQVSSGQARLVLAGGAESASTAPWRFWPPRSGHGAGSGRPGDDGPGDLVRYRRAPFAPTGWPDPEMGPAADALASVRGIGRERQDSYAARSHERAVAAQHSGDFGPELVAIGTVSTDERPRNLPVGRLRRLPPAFGPDGTVTAGNSSGISDGASVVAVTTLDLARAAGLAALRIVDTAVVAGDPALPGAMAAAAAIAVLGSAGVSARDVAVVEVSEAFASVAVSFADDLGIPDDRLCRGGGAIALGHPWGATGAVLVTRLFTQLTAAPGTGFGLAACAIGGGQGIAMLVEHCPSGTERP